jgi:hypothetical protein
MSRFIVSASAQRSIMWVVCILMLMVFACQRRTTEVISGIEIPIPGKMTKNTDKSFEPIPGFEDGQVSYQGKVSPSDIFTFYQEVMAADGWQPTARFADKKDRIAYFKGNRLVLIRYNDSPDGNGNTVLTIFAGTDVAAK